MQDDSILEDAELDPPDNTIIISFMPDAEHMVSFISQMLRAELPSCTVEAFPDCSAGSAVKTCSVYIPLLSPEAATSGGLAEEMETAMLYRRPTVPVIAAPGYRPEGWVSLAIAGLLYSNMPSMEAAMEEKYDSYPMQDFLVAVGIAANPKVTRIYADLTKQQELNKQLDLVKAKLGYWPPRTRHEHPPPAIAVRDEGELPDMNGLQMNYIHYNVTRTEFPVPAPLLDANGLPILQRFDVMISYQWDSQEFVHEYYMNLNMRNFKIWFDIWGGMVGNIYEAMAAAIERSKVFLAVVNSNYLQRPNCMLEMKYAIRRNKPVVIILNEPNLVLPDWMAKAVEGKEATRVWTLLSVQDLGVMDNGLAMFDRIAAVLRNITAAALVGREDGDVDESPACQALRDALEQGRMELAENMGVSYWKTCTRCGKRYDNSTVGGCKKHRAYYLGGHIIAGRWVCCNQGDQDGMGCEDCDHIEEEREFVCNPDYGTYTWEPA